MKLFKYLFLLFLLFTLAFVVFVATQPTTYNIKRTKQINMPVQMVFDYVNDYNNWSEWQKFDNSEKLDFKLSKNTVGKNASVVWDKTNSLKTTFISKDSIVQIFVEDDNKQTLHWKFNKTNSGTNTVVTIKGDLTFKEKIFSVLNFGITSYVGPQIEKGLDEINNYLVNELGNFKLELTGVVSKTETNFIERKDSCNVKDFPKHSKELLKSIKEFIKQNEIETVGQPFVIFKGNPTSGFMNYSLCVPVRDEILTTPESQIQGNNFKSFLAVKSTLIGDYSHIKDAWAKSRAYMVKNKLIEDLQGTYIGIYKKSYPEIKEPSKWVTEFYIPLLKKKPKRRVIKDTTAVSTPTDVPVEEKDHE
jgi:hypothetical protein